MKLDEARILLTGAAGGIGSAIARRLARSGARLLLTDLRHEPLDRLAAELCAAGFATAAVAADIGSESGRLEVLEAARMQQINVLINAAGVNPFGMLAAQTSADVATTMLINAIAPMALCQVLLPVLAARTPAHIVNVGSTFGSIGYPGFAVYSASKFAVRGFSEALRREVADAGIRVHYLAPRATRTALATDRIRAMNEELHVGMDSPETVALAVAAILRDERRELLLGTPERLFAKINALMPAIVDRVLRKQLPVIKRYAGASNGPAEPVSAPICLNARGAMK
jgi:short-subunit dehydrogenase